MGATGKSTSGGGAGGSVIPSGTSSDKYDYSQGSLNDAITQFRNTTGTAVDNAGFSKLNEDIARSILSEAHKLIDEGVKILNLNASKKMASNAMAQSNGSTIFFNPKYYSLTPDQLTQVYQNSVESGFHPNGDYKSILIHEAGHNVAHEYINQKIQSEMGVGYYATVAAIKDWNKGTSWSAKTIQKSLIIQACKNLGLKGSAQSNAKLISRYAGSKPCETIAEAYADYKSNGTNAHPLSQEIVKLLTQK